MKKYQFILSDKGFSEEKMNKIMLGVCLIVTASLMQAMKKEQEDFERAQEEAVKIMGLGSDVNKPNKSGETPLDYAEINKDEFPKVYEVMNAGKVKQDIEKGLRQSNTRLTDENLVKLLKAEATLKKYMFGNE